MGTWFRLGVGLAAVLLTQAPAAADNVGEALTRFEAASAAFAVGDYAEAGREYQAAYKLQPDPALLFDAAQAYRLAGNTDKALALYKSFLQFYPNHPKADVVQRSISRLKETPTAPLKPYDIDAPLKPYVDAPLKPYEAARPLAPSAVAATPLYKKWWLWTIVGAVAAGAVAAVVVLTWPAPSRANAPEAGPGRSALVVRW